MTVHIHKLFRIPIKENVSHGNPVKPLLFLTRIAYPLWQFPWPWKGLGGHEFHVASKRHGSECSVLMKDSPKGNIPGYHFVDLLKIKIKRIDLSGKRKMVCALACALKTVEKWQDALSRHSQKTISIQWQQRIKQNLHSVPTSLTVRTLLE